MAGPARRDPSGAQRWVFTMTAALSIVGLAAPPVPSVGSALGGGPPSRGVVAATRNGSSHHGAATWNMDSHDLLPGRRFAGVVCPGEFDVRSVIVRVTISVYTRL